MSISEYFRRLGAPLTNHMWSWGAERASDRAVFLRVWQDQERKVEGRWYTLVLHDKNAAPDPGNLGRLERVDHIKRIQAGAKCFLVMCEAKDVTAEPRSIKSFNDRDLFAGGQVVELDGDWWIERAGRVPAREEVVKG
jgi:hypothetical protein